MLTLALAFSVLLLGFAALSVFGLPYLIAGRRAVEEWPQRHDQQVLAAGLAGVVLFGSCVLTLPFALAAAGPHIQTFAETVLAAPSRFWS